MAGYYRRAPGNWLDDDRRRSQLQAAARRALPDLRYAHRQRREGPVDVWVAAVLPPGYDERTVTIEFERRHPTFPRVFADGPTESPHRYAERGRTRLCLWYPGDVGEQRWSVNDGLLALFGLAAHHLFKEAWWRETGEWLGTEAPHDVTLDSTAKQVAR